MSSIQINRGTKAEIDNTPVTDGLICFQTDDNFIYMDNGDTREAFGGVKVIPNPQEEPTEVLRNLQIADDVYKISGGHEIEDQSGTTLTQRDVMRFTGAYSHDDSTSEVTKIDIVREMTVAQKDTLTGDEVEGFQWTTDENNDLPLTTDWVAYRDGQSATEALDDAIKEVLNDNGDTLTSRGKIQFVGTYTEDDSTDEVTKVDIVREFNSVSDIENLTGEEAKGFQYLDDDVYDEFTAGDIGFDNSDTSFVGTNVQDVLEEVDDKTTWVKLGTLTSGGTGINISDYQELNIQPLVNGEYKYNPFHFIKNNINGAYLNIYEATHSWVGNFSVNSSGVLAFTTTLITGWSSMSLLVYGKK